MLAALAISFSTFVSFAGDVVLGIPGEKHSSIGIYIKDLKNDSIVFESEADRGHVPASVMKSFTVASAMSMLKPDFRFETKVYLTGTVKNGKLEGDIIIKASGDPTLESEFFPKQSGFIADIITALQNKGITKVNGDVRLARVVENRDYAEGPLDAWEIDDVCWAYGAGAFDFNYADNYFGLYPGSGQTSLPMPNLKYTIWSHPYGSGKDLIRGIYSDSLIVVGADYAKSKSTRVNTSMPYPFDCFRANLIKRLSAKGITVTEKPSDDDSRKLLLTHRSALIDEIFKSLLVRSDNMFAEGVLRMLGPSYGDRYASIDAEIALWESRGLEPQYNRIKDGSGLSRADYMTPRFIGQYLEWMAKSNMCSRYVSFFPVAGESGTMKSFMAKTPFKGRLAMKTGSMGAVQCYAGYLTDDAGKPTHVVVVLANNFYCERSQLKEAISDFLVEKLPNP